MLLGPAATASFEDWRRMVDLNLTAVLAATHAALPTCCGPPSRDRARWPTW